MQFWKYEIPISVLLKTGSAEWSVHGGDAHDAPEEDMLDVLSAPIYLDIYLQDLEFEKKFSFALKTLWLSQIYETKFIRV
jgi:hypothetical protein